MAKRLIKKLESHFLEYEVMITPIVVYPQYWATNGQNIEEKFQIHLSVLNATFCVPYKVVGESVKCFLILSSSKTLDMYLFFKTPMLHNVEAIM